LSLKKSQQAIPLQVPQRGPYGEGYPLTGDFYISLDISLYLKGPKKRASLHVPLKRGLYGNRRPFRALLSIYFGAPIKGTLPPGPPHGVPLERDALFLELSSISEVELCRLCQVIKDNTGRVSR